MRRRFTLAIVGVVVGALVVAGLGTILLLAIQARHEARHDVLDLATRIAKQAALPSTPAAPQPGIRNLQNFLKRTQDLTIIAVGPAGGTATALPRQLTVADLQRPALANGVTVSGFHGRYAYAAVPFTFRDRKLAVVVTQRTSSVGLAGLYFLLAAAVALVAAFVVAATLARRITRPLVTFEQTAGRIALGDLSARVPEPRDSYPELRLLASSINAMADNLERLRGQERQFLMSVSHDLRTPLTSIRGFAEALGDGTATDTPRAAGIIAAEARRLERLVRDLLDLAKLDARSFSFDVRPTDLSEVVSGAALGLEPTAEALGLDVVVHEPVVDAGERATPVAADPDRLAQVVANLVENACKYAVRSIDVAVWYRRTAAGPEALITVDDDGPGIAGEDLGHVFERLWTSSRGLGRQLGSGLGLAIVNELVTAMGGTVRAESPVPGGEGGTRLVVSLRPLGDATPARVEV